MLATAGCLNLGSEGEGSYDYGDDCTAGLVNNAAIGSVDGAWPEFGFDAANSGYNPDGSGHEAPAVAWRHTGCRPESETGLAVADGTVLVIDDEISGIRALEARTGETRWTVAEEYSRTVPAIADGTVYFAGRDFLALEMSTGSEQWRVDWDGSENSIIAGASPTVVDGTVYTTAGLDDPSVYALDAATGTRRSQWALDGDMAPEAPAVADGRVYATTDGGSLRSIATDGSDERVLIGPDDLSKPITPPAVADDTVFVGDTDGGVRASTPAGDEQWRTVVSKTGIGAPLVVGPDQVYVADDGQITALATSDGSELWQRSLEITGTPVRSGSTLYVGIQVGDPSGEAPLLGLDAASGATRWRVGTEIRTDTGGRSYGGLDGAPAVVDGVVFAATAAGDTYAFT